MRRSSVIVALLLLVLTAGCRQKVANQPRYEAYEQSTFFEDSMSARPIREGTVARGQLRLDGAYYQGTNPYYNEQGRLILPGGESATGYEERLVETFPFPVTENVVERGQLQFNIYCSPCHGRLGNGRGMVARRGLKWVPTFHTERLRNAPPGHFFNVMTNGYGAMYSYAARVNPEDRWAITAYIRALQMSQHATLADVPAAKRNEMLK